MVVARYQSPLGVLSPGGRRVLCKHAHEPGLFFSPVINGLQADVAHRAGIILGFICD